jgi:DNA mismatch endonuclease (patch repair protein)
MTDVFSKAERSKVMSGIRSRGNQSTELRIISIFKRLRITGWRRHYRLKGKPDFVFPKLRIALFIDGCFWHGCRRCYDGHLPKSNQEYWVAKIARNIRRDRLVNRSLRSLGWRVFRLSECRLRSDAAISRIHWALSSKK